MYMNFQILHNVNMYGHVNEASGQCMQHSPDTDDQIIWK